jgi:hypothetical protein
MAAARVDIEVATEIAAPQDNASLADTLPNTNRKQPQQCSVGAGAQTAPVTFCGANPMTAVATVALAVFATVTA